MRAFEIDVGIPSTGTPKTTVSLLRSFYEGGQHAKLRVSASPGFIAWMKSEITEEDPIQFVVDPNSPSRLVHVSGTFD